MAVFTTETRLSEQDAENIIEYAHQYRTEYGIIQRYVWHRIVQDKGKVNKSKLHTEVQHRFSVTKRTANSIIYDMHGRYRAVKELKKTEKYQIIHKINHLEYRAEQIADTVNIMKVKASANKLTEKQLVLYRNLKKKLYFLHQRIQKKTDILSQLEKDMSDGYYSLGFGSKKLFDAQYRLSENGYKSHIGWYNDYIKRRDCNIFYLGSKDETSGNQMFQLIPNGDGYDIKIRKDSRYATDSKYVIGHCSFKYLDDEIRSSIIDKDRPISYRIKLRGRKVYLQAIIQMDISQRLIATTMIDGAIGLDFNSGHIDLSETDSKGNLVGMKQLLLYHHGTGTRAENEMRQVVAEIGKYAMMKGKSIVKEDLSFIKIKSKTDKAKDKYGKDYNRMIHTLDYSRYENDIQNMVTRCGIDLIEVNPAYTSQIARNKYCKAKKIPIHNGAAYVIARRGQGFKDKVSA